VPILPIYIAELALSSTRGRLGMTTCFANVRFIFVVQMNFSVPLNPSWSKVPAGIRCQFV